MDAAKKSVTLCNDAFGVYPYPSLCIVMNGLTGGVSGMEYPMLVMASAETPLEDLAAMGVDPSDEKQLSPYTVPLDDTICHEIAHQWFYGIVGNDQISEAWLDESFCRFSEYLYEQAYPPVLSEEGSVYLKEDRFQDYKKRITAQGTAEGISYAPDTAYLEKSLYYWAEEDPMGYGDIYDKGASLIYEMQQQLGKAEFDSALKQYVAKFAYGFVTTADFQEFWNSQADFSPLFDLYFD